MKRTSTPSALANTSIFWNAPSVSIWIITAVLEFASCRYSLMESIPKAFTEKGEPRPRFPVGGNLLCIV